MSLEGILTRDIAAVRQSVLESTRWLTAEEITQAAELPEGNSAAQLSRWKRESRIFFVSVGGTERIPEYLLEPGRWRPLPGAAKAIATLAPMKNGWGMAYWFASVNSVLGGKRPMDLVGTRPELVAAAAADEASGIQHA
ncbi:MAG: hypothetical protein J0H15_10770 [Xanthomonadales bacterium]|nr:hypothetical protein [Xanthomonadales bacterium]